MRCRLVCAVVALDNMYCPGYMCFIAGGIGAVDHQMILSGGGIGGNHDVMMMDVGIALSAHVIAAVETKGCAGRCSTSGSGVAVVVEVVVYLNLVGGEHHVVGQVHLEVYVCSGGKVLALFGLDKVDDGRGDIGFVFALAGSEQHDGCECQQCGKSFSEVHDEGCFWGLWFFEIDVKGYLHRQGQVASGFGQLNLPVVAQVIVVAFVQQVVSTELYDYIGVMQVPLIGRRPVE